MRRPSVGSSLVMFAVLTALWASPSYGHGQELATPLLSGLVLVIAGIVLAIRLSLRRWIKLCLLGVLLVTSFASCEAQFVLYERHLIDLYSHPGRYFLLGVLVPSLCTGVAYGIIWRSRRKAGWR